MTNYTYKNHLKSWKSLVTSYEQTRAGFISLALEKNRQATPYIEEAKALKTANSALDRIRKAFLTEKLSPKTFFIGAAIENAMATEIFNQLEQGIMNNEANLTEDQQLVSICEWLINL